MPTILLIDDEEPLRDFVSAGLRFFGHRVECLDSAENGINRLSQARFDVVVIDNKMPRVTGLEFLDELRDRGIDVPVIMMTGESTPDTAIEATKRGAFDYVVKPGTYQELIHNLDPIIRSALEITRPVKEVRVSPRAAPADTGPVLVGGQNKRMLEVCKQIALFADANNPVLILGESGTGKELVARAFHTHSSRKAKPFVALNCTALNANLIENELFGHEKGAFTHAEKLQKGKIEYANGGTLFLDEIGDMPENLQGKLLRVVENQEFERLGSNETIKVNVRLISATNKNLEKAIQDGTFRSDLFYRLSQLTLRLPPLRDRLDDLPELVEFLLSRLAEATSRARPTVAPATLDRLRAHPWPGNIRELQNVIFRAFSVCRGQQVLPSHLHFDFPTEGLSRPAQTAEEEAVAGLLKAIAWAWNSQEPKPLPLLQERLEKELLQFALKHFNGNQSKVAEWIGMGRTTLDKRMKDHGLK